MCVWGQLEELVPCANRDCYWATVEGYVCTCVYSFVHVLVGTCAGFCGERRFMLAVFLSCSPSCVLRNGLTQPGSHWLARTAVQWVLGLLCVCLSCARVTDVCDHAYPSFVSTEDPISGPHASVAGTLMSRHPRLPFVKHFKGTNILYINYNSSPPV